MVSLLNKTVRLANPVKGEESVRYVVVEDNGDRLLIRLICDLPIPPVELVRREEVSAQEMANHRVGCNSTK
jgi:hypothetical protein